MDWAARRIHLADPAGREVHWPAGDQRGGPGPGQQPAVLADLDPREPPEDTASHDKTPAWGAGAGRIAFGEIHARGAATVTPTTAAGGSRPPRAAARCRAACRPPRAGLAALSAQVDPLLELTRGHHAGRPAAWDKPGRTRPFPAARGEQHRGGLDTLDSPRAGHGDRAVPGPARDRAADLDVGPCGGGRVGVAAGVGRAVQQP